MKKEVEQIDLVIPWVDGGDLAWQEEKAKYDKKTKGDNRLIRYRDWDNLQYVFRGIEQNLPWIHKVYFITCGHLPKWMNTECEKLVLVKHSDYIPKEFLPTFNANPIEMNMHRIKGLSEHFIYGNDDTFYMQPLKPTDFFKNGLPVDSSIETFLCSRRGGVDYLVANNLAVINDHFKKKETIKKCWRKWYSPKYKTLALKNLYMAPVRYFIGFNNPHVPNSFLKSTFETIWEKEADLLKETSSHKFRDRDDVSQWLARYWQLAAGRFSPCHPRRGKAFAIGVKDKEIKEAFEKNQYKMICLHDHDETVDFEKEKTFLLDLFEKKFPNKSMFEK